MRELDHIERLSAETPPVEGDREFGVVQPFPVIEFERGELITPPRQYTTIADRPEPVVV